MSKHTGSQGTNQKFMAYVNNIPSMLLFKMSTYGHFLPVSLHLPSTLYTKQNEKKITEATAKQYNLKTFRRWPFHYVTLAQSNYYLNLFHTNICTVGYLDMYVSKYNKDASFILANTIGSSVIPWRISKP